MTLTGAAIREPTVRKAHQQCGPAPSSPELHAEHWTHRRRPLSSRSHKAWNGANTAAHCGPRHKDGALEGGKEAETAPHRVPVQLGPVSFRPCSCRSCPLSTEFRVARAAGASETRQQPRHSCPSLPTLHPMAAAPQGQGSSMSQQGPSRVAGGQP